MGTNHRYNQKVPANVGGAAETHSSVGQLLKLRETKMFAYV